MVINVHENVIDFFICKIIIKLKVGKITNYNRKKKDEINNNNNFVVGNVI